MLNFKPEHQDDFVNSIMEQTTGRGCDSALSNFNEGFDGDSSLDPIQQELASEHISSCIECQAVVENLPKVMHAFKSETLWEPDPHFARDVLIETSKLPSSRIRRWLINVNDRVDHLILSRPRIALEAAYVLTIVFILAFHWTKVPVTKATEQLSTGKQAITEVSNRVDLTLTDLTATLHSNAVETSQKLSQTGESISSRGRALVNDTTTSIRSFFKNSISSLLSKGSNLLGRLLKRTEDSNEQSSG